MTNNWSNSLNDNISKCTARCIEAPQPVSNDNKSAQSNLGRGPRRGTVAHVRRKVPIGYNGVPHIRPLQKYPFLWTDPQTPLPASYPWIRPSYDAKRHPDLIRRFSTIHWTDRRTDAPTDRQIVHGKV